MTRNAQRNLICLDVSALPAGRNSRNY